VTTLTLPPDVTEKIERVARRAFGPVPSDLSQSLLEVALGRQLRGTLDSWTRSGITGEAQRLRGIQRHAEATFGGVWSFDAERQYVRRLLWLLFDVTHSRCPRQPDGSLALACVRGHRCDIPSAYLDALETLHSDRPEWFGVLVHRYRDLRSLDSTERKTEVRALDYIIRRVTPVAGSWSELETFERDSDALLLPDSTVSDPASRPFAAIACRGCGDIGTWVPEPLCLYCALPPVGGCGAEAWLRDTRWKPHQTTARRRTGDDDH
jgi:hypothetical protein